MGTSKEVDKGTVDSEKDSIDPQDNMVPTFGRWLLLAAGAVNFGCGLGLPISLSVMFLDWQESFSTTRAVTAAVHSTCVGIVFGGGVVAGYVTNRFGARVSFVLGSFLAALGMFLGAFATSIHFLLATVGVLAGCGCCLVQLPTIPCITRPFKDHQAVAIAGVSTGGAVITLALPYLYDYLIHTYSWRGGFIIISGLCLNTLVLQLVLTSYIPTSSSQLSVLVPSPEATHLVSDSGNDAISPKAENKNGRPSDMGGEAFLQVQKLDDKGNSNAKNGSAEQEEMECFMALTFHQDDTLATKGDVHDNQTEHTSNAQVESGWTKSGSTSVPMDRDSRVNLSGTSLDPIHSGHFLTRLSQSAWRFLLYPLTWSNLAFLGLTLGVQFTSQMLTMDIAANKGFPEHGLFLIMLGILTGLVGKFLSGVLGLFRKLPSFLILGASGVVGSGALAMMGVVTSFSATATSVSIVGLSLGVIVSVFPKCFLDLPSMDAASYPLALGLGNTVEGVFDFLVPILVGHMVDESGSYKLPFSILSVVSFLCSCVLILVYLWTKRKQQV